MFEGASGEIEICLEVSLDEFLKQFDKKKSIEPMEDFLINP